MKTFFLSISIFLTCSSNAQIIKIGDNLKTEFNKINKPYFFKGPNFTGWTEGSGIFLIGAKSNANDCDFLLLSLKDTTLIGVFKTSQPNIFLFDTEGNSILSAASDFFFLPEWTVKNKTKVSATDKTIYNVLDELYEQTLQADDGQPDERTIKKYQQFQTDTTLANRHIALLFDTYQNIISETVAKGEKAPAETCVSLMKTLANECISVYKSIPAIVCIYMGEALENAGMTDEARKHFQMSLGFYPNSIPLLVYNYRLEQDPGKKKQQLSELKKKYPNHWMVRDL